MTRALSVLMFLSLSACGLGDKEPTVIDGSSAEAYARTMSEARSDLTPKERLKFEAALTEYKAQMFARADNRQEYNRLVQEGMDGLTAPAIVRAFDVNAERARTGAADAIFDAKRLLTGTSKQ